MLQKIMKLLYFSIALATTQTTQSAVITTNGPAVQSSSGQIIQSTSGQVQPVYTNGPATSGQVVTSGGDNNYPITSKYTGDSGGSKSLFQCEVLYCCLFYMGQSDQAFSKVSILDLGLKSIGRP